MIHRLECVSHSISSVFLYWIFPTGVGSYWTTSYTWDLLFILYSNVQRSVYLKAAYCITVIVRAQALALRAAGYGRGRSRNGTDAPGHTCRSRAKCSCLLRLFSCSCSWAPPSMARCLRLPIARAHRGARPRVLREHHFRRHFNRYLKVRIWTVDRRISSCKAGLTQTWCCRARTHCPHAGNWCSLLADEAFKINQHREREWKWLWLRSYYHYGLHSVCD